MTRRAFKFLALAIAGCSTTALALVAAAQQASQEPPAGGATPDGKAIYESRCANCHGTSGKGDGPAAGLLLTRPRDFTSGKFKIRTTESGSLPTDDDMVQAIGAGMHGTAMPEWKPLLSDAEIRAVAGYIKTFSRRFETEQPAPVTLRPAVASSDQSIAKGEKVYERLHCASCHGTDGTGTDAISTDLKDEWGQPLMAARLTEPWNFRGGSTARDIYVRVRTGVNGTPMPSFKEAATDEEMWHVANYVVSLARKPVWEMTAEEAQGFYRDLDEQEKADKVKRGQYLLNTLGCAFCHSPIRENGAIVSEFKFAGGQRTSLYPFGEYVTYNLTSDQDTGLGSWSDDQIKNAVTRGTLPNGSRLLPFPMPWTSYGSLTPTDLDAIVAGLRSLPAVSNTIPAPKQLSLIPYLWGKFQILILQRDIPGTGYPGNAGTPRQGQSWQTPAR